MSRKFRWGIYLGVYLLGVFIAVYTFEQVEAARIKIELPEQKEAVKTEAEKKALERHLYKGAIKPGMTLVTALRSHGTALEMSLDEAIRKLHERVDLTRLRPGDTYELTLDGFKKAQEITLTHKKINKFTAKRFGDEWIVNRGAIEKTVGQFASTIVIEGGLEQSFHAIEEGGLPAKQTVRLAQEVVAVLKYDIDFHTQTRKGDVVRVVYELVSYNGGEVQEVTKALAVRYMGKKVDVAYVYSEDEKKYFDEKGIERFTGFLKSPLSVLSISSNYGWRVHPIRGKRHFHGGVDYRAPTGTPVFTVADGKVILSRKDALEGNWIKVRHKGDVISYYLHLSRRKVKVGDYVRQGQVIGLVGSTGSSTGPHLDFRLRKHGKYINPTKKVSIGQTKLSGEKLARYRKNSEPYWKFLNQ